MLVLKLIGTHTQVAYGLLLQDMARLSEFFCDRANYEGLVDVLVVAANIYQYLPSHAVSCHLSTAYLSRSLWQSGSYEYWLRSVASIAVVETAHQGCIWVLVWVVILLCNFVWSFIVLAPCDMGLCCPSRSMEHCMGWQIMTFERHNSPPLPHCRERQWYFINVSGNLSSDVSAGCSSHPQDENEK